MSKIKTIAKCENCQWQGSWKNDIEIRISGIGTCPNCQKYKVKPETIIGEQDDKAKRIHRDNE